VTTRDDRPEAISELESELSASAVAETRAAKGTVGWVRAGVKEPGSDWVAADGKEKSRASLSCSAGVLLPVDDSGMEVAGKFGSASVGGLLAGALEEEEEAVLRDVPDDVAFLTNFPAWFLGGN